MPITDDAKEANLSTFTPKASIPILRNHKDIKTGEKLIMHGQKRAIAEEEPASSGHGKKRAR